MPDQTAGLVGRGIDVSCRAMPSVMSWGKAMPVLLATLPLWQALANMPTAPQGAVVVCNAVAAADTWLPRLR